MEFDFSKLSVPEAYRLMVDAIVPRPIAFVSTQGQDGTNNLAPFSYFNAVSTNPPCVMISVTRKRDGGPKDTLHNILETRQFVVNSANEWLADAINQCAAEYPYGVDEMQKTGLTPAASTKVRPLRVSESTIQMECELLQTIELGTGGHGSTTLVLGKILTMHVRDELFKNGRIDVHEYKPLARLGGNSYSKLGEVFDLERPKA
jgi:flavin reductase (DIM6/NTAB) family NADH-FMN oxidoreductase RutF